MWAKTAGLPAPSMWPAINAVLALREPLLRYQNAWCHDRVVGGPSARSITFFAVSPTPTIGAFTPIDGMRSCSGTAPVRPAG